MCVKFQFHMLKVTKVMNVRGMMVKRDLHDRILLRLINLLKAQNETSTSQKFTNLQIIVGHLSASTTSRRQLLECCDQLAKVFLDVGVGFLF